MATSSRSALITKTHRVLKKHYTAVAPPTDRSLMEHLLYACCLEDADFEKADEAFALLQQLFFDWNEVRVTTVAELAQVMKTLPDAETAARRIKSALQNVFESLYSYDLEALKKLNIGKAIKKLEKYKGVTPFAVAYVNQNALGGHAIANDQGTLGALLVLGIASAAEAQKKHVPGMERAIPKSKGVEFASLLHQLGAAFYAAPFSPRLRSILLEINPQAKQRLPKRTRKKPATDESSSSETAKAVKKSDAGKKTSKRKAAPVAAKKKSTAAKPAAAKSKKKAKASSSARRPITAKKKSSTRQLARRKPR